MTMGAEATQRRRKPLLARHPYTIDVAFPSTPPETVVYLGIFYDSPTPVKPSDERSHIGYTFVYRYTIQTKPKPVNADSVNPDVMPTMKTVQSGFAKSSDRIQQPTIVDNFLTGVSLFWAEVTGVEKPPTEPVYSSKLVCETIAGNSCCRYQYYDIIGLYIGASGWTCSE